jgi:acetoin utilization protein AcuB
MTVKQLMSTSVVTIDDQETCREAVALMCRHKVRHLPVVSRHGVLSGIVTDRDLRHYLFRSEVFRSIGNVPVEQLLTAAPVRQVMSSPVVWVEPDASLEDAAGRMRQNKLGSLPVVDNGRIIGIVTETDLLRRIVGRDTGAADVATIVVSYP